MQVVILCGGLGTRLGAEATVRPKPMVQIGERPILWHIMKYYASFGHKDFVLCLGYKGEMIKDYFLNYQSMTNDVTIELGKEPRLTFHSEHGEQDWRVTLADTGQGSLTGTRIKRIEPYVKGDRFLATYGDGLSTVDLAKLVAFHEEHGRVATLTTVHPPARFGEMVIQDDQVTRFSEKPQTSAGLINGGYFVFDRKIFDYIPEDENTTLEQQPMQRLTEDGELMAYNHTGFWQCMDTVRELEMLRDLWGTGEAPWASA